MTCDHDLAERERAERAESEARLWLSEYNRLRQEIADATERCVAHLAERDALKAGCDVLRAELRSIGKALQDPQDNLTRTTAECIASLRAERDALRDDLHDLRRSTQERIDRLESEGDNVHKLNMALVAERDALRAENERQEQEIATSRQKHKEDAAQIVDLLHERDALGVTLRDELGREADEQRTRAEYAEAERDALRAERETLYREYIAARTEAEAVKAERDALKEDAERYRQLRKPHPRWEVRYWNGKWWDTLDALGLDAAIDAGRGK